MKVFPKLLAAACVVGIFVSEALAADAPPARQMVIPVNVANRGVGAVQCAVNLGPAVPAVAIAFSPDGKTLAVSGYQEVLLWDLAGAKLAKRLPASGFVGALAFLKDGKTLAIGEGMPSAPGAVRLVDLTGGKDVCRFAEARDVVVSLALSPDGKLLAGSSLAKDAFVWDVEQKKLVTTLQGHTDRVLHVAFSADGKFLVTSSQDSSAQVWSAADWTAVIKFTEPYPVRGAAVHPDGVQVLMAEGGTDGAGLKFRKTDTPTYRRPIGISGGTLPLGMAGPTKIRRVYVPCADKTVKVYNIESGAQLATLVGHQDWVQSVALSADETKVAAGCADGSVKIWAISATPAQDARLLATLLQLAPRSDQWLLVTAAGYVATSTSSAFEIRADKIVTPLGQVMAQLQNPELVAKTIAGEKVPPPVVK